jgi:catechol 2,3-dioxygenase-like lactoylglutathione lyase family enzyme
VDNAIAKRAHHVSLVVRDLAGARRFYGALLGLREIDRPDFGFPGAWYQAGDVQLHLIVPPPGVDAGAPPRALSPLAAHLAFEIDDYDAVRAALERAGLAVLGLGPEVGQLFVRDPDGNGIELIRPGGRLGRRPRSPQ